MKIEQANKLINKHENEDIPKINSQLEQSEKQLNYISVAYAKNTPLATFVIDDGDLTFETSGYRDCFNTNSIRGTLGIITKAVEDNTSTKMNLPKLKELANDGWDLVSHSYTHSNVNYGESATATDEEILNDMKLSQKWIKDNGFNGDVLVYPYGNFGSKKDRYVRLSKQVYKYAINSTGNLNSSPLDTMYLSRCDMSQTIEAIRAQIDKCVQNNNWIIFLIHTYTSANVTIEKLQQTIDYLKSKSVEILTFKNAIEKRKNALSIGNIESGLYVGNDGKTNISIPNSEYQLGESERRIDTSISDFPLGTEVKTISASIGTEFPEGQPGLLITCRPINDYYAYQLYIIKWSKKIYMRYWTSNNEWSSFESIIPIDNNIIKYSTDERKITTPLGSFKDGVEYRTISTSLGVDFPEGKPGLLETNKNPINRFYSYQVYHIKDSVNAYIRWWTLNSPDSSEFWGEFKLM